MNCFGLDLLTLFLSDLWYEKRTLRTFGDDSIPLLLKTQLT
jgi:hypothetical protein